MKSVTHTIRAYLTHSKNFVYLKQCTEEDIRFAKTERDKEFYRELLKELIKLEIEYLQRGHKALADYTKRTLKIDYPNWDKE